MVDPAISGCIPVISMYPRQIARIENAIGSPVDRSVIKHRLEAVTIALAVKYVPLCLVVQPCGYPKFRAISSPIESRL